MTVKGLIGALTEQEDLNFLLTNRIPRAAVTRFMGWFSQIEQPQVRDLSLWLWQRTADLRLDEAKQREFRSLHDCFVRELAPGARPLDLSPGPPTRLVQSGRLEVCRMCGIAGALDLGAGPCVLDTVDPMTACLYHRGPDEDGLYRDEHVALGPGERSLSPGMVKWSGYNLLRSWNYSVQVLLPRKTAPRLVSD